MHLIVFTHRKLKSFVISISTDYHRKQLDVSSIFYIFMEYIYICLHIYICK